MIFPGIRTGIGLVDKYEIIPVWGLWGRYVV